MPDIIPNVVVSMPNQLFTLPTTFAPVAGGSLYIGRTDTDPSISANQIQVYAANEDGTYTAVNQPIEINVGGYPVYGGQIAKFVTVEGQSMAIYDASDVLQFYYPNVLKYDPDQFAVQLALPNGPQVGYQQDTSAYVIDLREKEKQSPTVREFADNTVTDTDMGPYLASAMRLGGAKMGGGEITAERQFNVLSDVQLPGATLTGNGWYGAIIHGNDDAILRVNSGTVLRDLLIDASQYGATQNGAIAASLVNGSPINRFTYEQVRVNNAIGNAFYFNICQNSTLRGCYAQNSTLYGYYIQGAENLVFEHCNSNQASGSQTGARGIYIDIGSNNSTLPRQVRFHYGIFERGNSDYQVEIVQCSSVFFDHSELNGGTLATVRLRNPTGVVEFDNVVFTRNQNDGLCVDGDDAAPYRVKGRLAVGGSGARVPSSLFTGTPIFDEYPWRPFIKSDFRGGSLSCESSSVSWSRYGSSVGTQFSLDSTTHTAYLSSSRSNEGCILTPFAAGFAPAVGTANRFARIRCFCYAVNNVILIRGLTTTQVLFTFKGISVSTELQTGFNEFYVDLPTGLLGLRLTSDGSGTLGEAYIANFEMVWM